MSSSTSTPMVVAGASQIVSGLANAAVLSWLMATVLGTTYSTIGGVVTGVCSAGMCPIGVFCGFCGLGSLLLIPLGLAEIGVGIYAIVAGPRARTAVRVTAILEILSIFLGSFTGLIAGIVALVGAGAAVHVDED